MKSKTLVGILITVIIIAIIIVCVTVFLANKKVSTSSTTQPVQTTNTYGMNQYVDSTYGFSFWYPSSLHVTSTTTNDTTSFPGGIAVETLQVGSLGGTSVIVVNSPTSTITDEPANHASPIAQTKYSYDTASKQWIISYPEGPNGPGIVAPAPADISKTTMAGLIMLPSGKRFDTTIIPLSTTRFLVISDGGGSSFTNQLAQTVAETGTRVSSTTQESILQAESNAYSSAGQ